MATASQLRRPGVSRLGETPGAGSPERHFARNQSGWCVPRDNADFVATIFRTRTRATAKNKGSDGTEYSDAIRQSRESSRPASRPPLNAMVW